ncbi:uncharacterized protein LOC110974981 isoform X2 [Acanthaster planci]|uniref:Uncharacterized protein LOC110974981 isoform X2 n=1 Tax=Acanthaster planci TaxID=133434 RepID=A0A8B7XRP4_ACAPL|nr:uncharacterized protein LOC110974981 isoform X2 [Acanthaster planci]
MYNLRILTVVMLSSLTCSVSTQVLEDADILSVGNSRLKRKSRSTESPTYVSSHEVIVHRGQRQHIRCPSLRQGEEISLIFWFRGGQLLARYAHPDVGSNFVESDQYGMSDSHELIINNVDTSDQGDYACSVVPSATGLQRKKTISVTVQTDVPDYREAVYPRNNEAYVFRNQTHHIKCPSYRQEEAVSLIFWFKGDRLVARFANPEVGTNFISSRNFWMSSSHGLVIKQVKPADGGNYACSVVPSATGLQRKRSLKVTVLDSEFPACDGSCVINKTTIELERGQKDEVPCPIQRMHRQGSTICWSLGNGEANATSIIGVKFFDGQTVVKTEYHDNYRINEDGSLVLHSLDALPTRFWCHVFLDRPGLSSAHCDVSFGSSIIYEPTTRTTSLYDELVLQTFDLDPGEISPDSSSLSAASTSDGSQTLYVILAAPLVMVLIFVICVRRWAKNYENKSADGGVATTNHDEANRQPCKKIHIVENLLPDLESVPQESMHRSSISTEVPSSMPMLQVESVTETEDVCVVNCRHG